MFSFVTGFKIFFFIYSNNSSTGENSETAVLVVQGTYMILIIYISHTNIDCLSLFFKTTLFVAFRHSRSSSQKYGEGRQTGKDHKKIIYFLTLSVM
jgi:hypothetical protein